MMRIVYFFLFNLILLGQLLAADFRLGVTNSTLPYYNNESLSGIEIEIIKSAVKAAGLSSPTFLNLHYQRAISQTLAGNIDAFIGNKNNSQYKGLKLYSSQETIRYVDCAISLKSNGFKINGPKDLQGKKIWAFKSASYVLGPEFNKMAMSNPDYFEKDNHAPFAQVLFKNRIDFAILDRNIFMSFLEKDEKLCKSADQLAYHKISPATPRAVIFGIKTMRDRFDRGLKQIKKNGSYQKILKKYQKSYHSSCQ